jgi:hypothetical protein
VILHLRAVLSSSDFHILIRKFPLGKVLYLSYCKQHDVDGLEDWFVQEDDFLNLAKYHFAQAYKSSRSEIRTAHLFNSQEYWGISRNESFQALTDENHRLLKMQSALADKIGKSFAGMTLKQTAGELLMLGELKQAEKLRSDFKMAETSFAWLRVKAMARNHHWPELKKYAKQKRMPLSTANVIRIVKQQAGDAEAAKLLTEDFVTHSERYSMYAEFGMFVEAANSAFLAKSMNSLTALEAMARDKQDVIKVISNLKMKLQTKQ